MIPQDIKDKIDEEAKKFAGISESKSVQNARERKFKQAIEKGYSLASPKQDEQEQLWEEFADELKDLTDFDLFRKHRSFGILKSKYSITRNPIK